MSTKIVLFTDNAQRNYNLSCPFSYVKKEIDELSNRVTTFTYCKVGKNDYTFFVDNEMDELCVHFYLVGLRDGMYAKTNYTFDDMRGVVKAE